MTTPMRSYLITFANEQIIAMDGRIKIIDEEKLIESVNGLKTFT